MTDPRPEEVVLYRTVQPEPPGPWEEMPGQPFDQARIIGNPRYESATFTRNPDPDSGEVLVRAKRETVERHLEALRGSLDYWSDPGHQYGNGPEIRRDLADLVNAFSAALNRTEDV